MPESAAAKLEKEFSLLLSLWFWTKKVGPPGRAALAFLKEGEPQVRLALCLSVFEFFSHKESVSVGEGGKGREPVEKLRFSSFHALPAGPVFLLAQKKRRKKGPLRYFSARYSQGKKSVPSREGSTVGVLDALPIKQIRRPSKVGRVPAKKPPSPLGQLLSLANKGWGLAWKGGLGVCEIYTSVLNQYVGIEKLME